MANVKNVLFGLLMTAILVMTMIPAGMAGFDGDSTADTGVAVSETNTGDNAVFYVYFDQQNTAAETLTVVVTGVLSTESVTKTVNVPNGNGVTRASFLTEDVLGADYDADIYDITIAVTGSLDVNANGVYDAELVVNEYTPENSISEEMFDLDKVVDQTGKKDELNPGDEFDAYIEIDAEKDDVDVSYHGMYLSGRLYDTVTGEFLGEDETRSFTLGDETETTKVLSFKLPKLMDLSEDKETDRLILAVEVFAYEQTYNEEAHGHSTLYFPLDLEAKEDSLYVVEASAAVDTVKAGESVSVDTEIANDGVETQENVKVTIAIEELEVAYKTTIASIENDDSKVINAGLAIPANARAGEYDITVTVESEQGAKDSFTSSIEVEGRKSVTSDTEIDVVGEDEKALGSDGTATFTFELTNNGSERKVYEFEVEGVDAEVSKDKLTVEAGETKEFTVTAEEAGEFTVSALVDGEVEADYDAEATAAATATKEQVVQVLQWVFAAIIIVAIILVIVWAVTKGRKGDDKEVYY